MPLDAASDRPPEPYGRGAQALLVLHLAALAAWFGWAYVDFQPTLMRGDHGRDLYCFARTAAGEVPYRDFQWIYGPLMPYVYAALFRLFGTSLLVVRAGFLAVSLAGCACAFLAARRALGPASAHAVAFLVLLWGRPHHSYVHVALLLAIAAGTWALLGLLDAGALRPRALAGVFLAGVVAGLAKWTSAPVWIGAATLVLLIRTRLVAAPELRRRDTRVLLLAAAGSVALVIAVHVAFLLPVPAAHRNLCLDVFGTRWGEGQSVVGSILALPTALSHLWAGHPGAGWVVLQPGVLLPFLLLVALVAGAAWILGRVRSGAPWDPPALRILALWVLSLTLSHEFYLMGSLYSLYCHTLVPLLLLAAALLARSPAHLPRGLARLGRALPLLWVLTSTLWIWLYVDRVLLTATVHLSLPRGGGVRIGTPAQREELEAAAASIARLTPAGEPVAVLPYDLLISFLADRPSPFYATMPIAGFHLDEAAEQEMIDSLEGRRVRCLVLSNHTMAFNSTVGFLGFTYLRRLAAHLSERFEPVAGFGFEPWDVCTGFVDGQQSIVYWRKGEPRPAGLPR